MPYILKPHLARFIKLYHLDDADIPKELFMLKSEKPDLDGFPYPLPSKKSEYTCFSKVGNVIWMGASTGLTRYDPDAEYEYDKVMYFSAHRDLHDNNVKAVTADENGAWVLTSSGASRIDMKKITSEEKADILLDECVNVVMRQGFVSQKRLKVPGDVSSFEKFAHSDNDGGFTAGLCMGELMHYAVLKRELGADNPKTKKIREIAVTMLESCMLALYVVGLDNGFMARTVLTADSEVPDDGLFWRRQGNKVVLIDTTAAKMRGMAGKTIEIDAKIPERLKNVYKKLGYTDDDIIFKTDTSSDEITLQLVNLYFAHKIIGDEDKELDALIKNFCDKLCEHIINNGREYKDIYGGSTTWAKWSLEYFATDLGWIDACLNSAELLMFIKVTDEICGENEFRKNAYAQLIADGYADLSPLHLTRLLTGSYMENIDYPEMIMYGDHMLQNMTYWGLLFLGEDKENREKFKKGTVSWRESTVKREHHPIYDFPFILSCPEEKIDYDKCAEWFYRFNTSMLASGTSTVSRHDIAKKIYRNNFFETSALLPPDEKFISKYDRNPLYFINEDSGGNNTVESCAQYNTAYWIGRYYNLIEEAK